MKKYVSPEMSLTEYTKADILNGSDVLIDVKSLFEEQN